MKDNDDNIASKKVEICAKLAALGVYAVVARYQGSGDSGNVESLEYFGPPTQEEPPPDGPEPDGEDDAWDDIGPEITTRLPTVVSESVEDFAWGCAYGAYPGFENNEGGYGTLIWDIALDSIILDHADRYVECSHSYVEGL